MKERARRFSQLFYPSDNIQCRLEIFMGAQAPMTPMLPMPLSVSSESGCAYSDDPYGMPSITKSLFFIFRPNPHCFKFSLDI